MLSYGKLWLLLESRGMKKTDLKKIISGNTLAKLGKNETVSSSVIEKICAYLDCQPGDIMEYINEQKLYDTLEQMGNINQILVNGLKEQGVSKEEFKMAMEKFISEIYDGENPLIKLMEETKLEIDEE